LAPRRENCLSAFLWEGKSRTRLEITTPPLQAFERSLTFDEREDSCAAMDKS
jgi:hypothetical protein